MSQIFDRIILDGLAEIAVEAGQAIMDVYSGQTMVWEKSDASPLTEADLRADRIIRSGLETRFPGIFILSEESRSSDVDMGRGLFLVDPLDGTKEFLKRNDEFTVNIAFHDGNGLIAGVVYAPALDELFFAAVGVGAWKRVANQETVISVAPASGERALRVTGSRSHGADMLVNWLKALPEHSFVPAGSSLKFCRIAEGAADLYPRFGPTSQWDTAAAQCILECAGGRVVAMSGEGLRYGLLSPILNPYFFAVGDPSVLALLPSPSASNC